MVKRIDYVRKLPVILLYVKKVCHDEYKATLLLSDTQNTKSINGTINLTFFKAHRSSLKPGTVLLLQDVVKIFYIYYKTSLGVPGIDEF